MAIKRSESLDLTGFENLEDLTGFENLRDLTGFENLLGLRISTKLIYDPHSNYIMLKTGRKCACMAADSAASLYQKSNEKNRRSSQNPNPSKD